VLKSNGINRIIDANINRLKEGLRVCEEISRFIMNDRKLTVQFKKTRHSLDSLACRLAPIAQRLRGRKSLKDVGKNVHLETELKRNDLADIFYANIQRVKESTRVLEEFAKLKRSSEALGFKKIRYEIYELEKKVITKLPCLRRT
jgi:thiamine-phosphate pyrophosphorylase